MESFLEKSYEYVRLLFDTDKIKTYPERMHLLFGNNDKHLSYPEHQECIAEIESLEITLNGDTDCINTKFQLALAYAQTKTPEDALTGVENELRHSCQLGKDYIALSQSFETCNWVNGNDISILENRLRHFCQLIDADLAKEFQILQEMPEVFRSMENYIFAIVPHLEMAAEYISGNMSKFQLHKLLFQQTFIYLQEKIFQLNNYLSEMLLAKYVKLIMSENHKYMAMYEYILVSFKFPLLNSATIKNYGLVKEALRLSNEMNHTKMGQLVEKLNENVETSFLELVQEFHEERFPFPDKVQDEIVKKVDTFLQNLSSFQGLLDDYQDKFNLDVDFFMWVPFCWQEYPSPMYVLKQVYPKLVFHKVILAIFGFIICQRRNCSSTEIKFVDILVPILCI